MRLMLLGPPGAGKGTQARLITAQYPVVHISTGDLLRTAMGEGSASADEIQRHVSKGALVPDSIVRKMLLFSIVDLGFEGFMLDGYPRTEAQAAWLAGCLEAYKAPLDAVICLRADEAILTERLAGRRVHAVTGEIFHMDYHPAGAEVDPVALKHLSDDHPESIRNRLAVYERETAYVEAYYQEAGLLHTVDATGTITEVYATIATILEGIRAAKTMV